MYNDLIFTLRIIATLFVIVALATFVRFYTIKRIVKRFGSKLGYLIDTRLTFIGVIHHELSHMIIAIITGAKVIKANIFKPQSDGTLGSVTFSPSRNFIIKNVQLELISIAPIILGSVSLYFLYTFGVKEVVDMVMIKNFNFDKNTLIKCFLTLLLMTHISYHMSISKQDKKHAIRGFLVTAVIVFIIVAIISNTIGINYESVLDIILNYSLVVMMCILINFVVWTIITIKLR